MKDLNGKVALVTGAASGIGFGIAEALGAAGMRVIVTDLREASVRDAGSRLARDGVTYLARTLDVRDRTAFCALAEEVESSFGPVQVLCNNAGIGLLGSLKDATYADWDWVMGVNVGGVIKTLLEKRLITTAGRKEVIGRPILYRTSKQFMIRFGLSDLDELPSLKEFEQLAQAALGSDTGIAPVEPGEGTVGAPAEAPVAVAQGEDDNDLAELGEDTPEVVAEALAQAEAPSGQAPEAGLGDTDAELPEDSKAASAAAGNSEPS